MKENSKSAKYGKMSSFKLGAKKNEGSESVILPIRRIIELASMDGVLTKPVNQRDVKKNDLSKGAAKYFASLLWTVKYGKNICKKHSAISELENGNPVIVGDITLTQKPSLKNFDYQDGQHRIQFMSAIFNDRVSVKQKMNFYNKDIPELIDDLYSQATDQGVDVSDGIFFSMLPDDIQDAILNLSFNVNVYYLNREEACRTLYDIKNTCVNMTNLNRQKNIYAGCPIYERTNALVKSFKVKRNPIEHPDFMKVGQIKVVNQMMNSKTKGKSAMVTDTAMIPLLYRCMWATEIPTTDFLNNQRAWNTKSAAELNNRFLADHENLSEKKVDKLLSNTCDYIYKLSKMLNDTNNETSIFAGKLALLPAGILMLRIMEEKSKTNPSIKKEVSELFKQDDVYDRFLSLCSNGKDDKLCPGHSTEVSSTYYRSEYVFTVFSDVYLASSPLIRKLFNEED